MRLEERTLDVWRLVMPPAGRPSEVDLRVLSDEELERARSFTVPDAAHTFVAARASLRRILAVYLAAPPASLRLAAEQSGRPRLLGVAGRWIRFSVSHSGRLALFAVAREAAVGIDVERIRSGVDVPALARRILTAAALDRLLDSPPARRRPEFFSRWCAYEAVLKARGFALFGAGAGQLAIERDRRDGLRWADASGTGWRLHELDVRPGYRAVVAVRSPAALRLRRFAVTPRSPARIRVP